MIDSLPSHLFFSLPRILYSLTRNKKEFLRNVLFLYSLVFPLLACFPTRLFFLYSSPRGAPEAPNERFPKVLQGFGLFRVSPAGRNVFFSLLVQQMPPGGAEIAVFPMVLKDFGDF